MPTTRQRLTDELRDRRKEIKDRRKRIDALAPGDPRRSKLVRYQRKVRARAALVRSRLIKINRAANSAPKIVDLKLRAYPGTIGSIYATTGHYTAGPKDTSDSHAAQLFYSYDSYHRSKGWVRIGYHFGIGRSGTIFLLRPATQIGAHVGNWNTGNVGIVCHGSTGDRPTDAQVRSYKWLLKNAHTSAMPVSHRVSSSLEHKIHRGHNDWPGHGSNSCPGLFKSMYRAG